ncbi:universal stress protein [Enhygromyxa salina]|uniref:Universal stress protein UspC n=1 Tax=Enhygromyxa salina TaxID=215803 RepID=A0A2S9YQ17_9BACT|nr:universal stress protein [Enhygromyxa salina]PRQ07168.1 universal stress protein UspC [Enhygromyxa salina]
MTPEKTNLRAPAPTRDCSMSLHARVSIGRACLGRSLVPPIVRGPATEPVAHVARNHPRRRVAAVIPEHVLVTTDGSDSAHRAIPAALAAIRACGSSRVTLLRVLTPKHAGPVHALEWAMARAHAEMDLERLAAQLPLEEKATSVVAEGRAAEQILHFIDTEEVDLIVIASHGSDGSRSWRMGSTTRKVISSGPVSLLVVPAEPPSTAFEHILVPLDCSARAEHVLPLVARVAQAHDAQITLAHVVQRPDSSHHLPSGTRERGLIEELTQHNRQRAKTYLEAVSERLAGRGLRVQIKLLSDTNPARAIERLASSSNTDLVLLCAHGGGCAHGERYGSVARRLLDSLVKPVWIAQDLAAEAPPRFTAAQSVE